MSEIHYAERVPRRSDFCGCPPCPLCYEPVITDDQQAPTFTEVMKEIYQDGPMPQAEQEYEWAHAAAHQMRKELDERRPDGSYFEEQDRARMTAMQVDDMLKRAKRAAEAPKPLNRVNLDDMPMAAIQAATVEQDTTSKKRAAATYEAARAVYAEAYNQMIKGQFDQVQQLAMTATIAPSPVTLQTPVPACLSSPASDPKGSR